MELKIGEMVKLLDFDTMVGLGKPYYKNIFSKPIIEYPDKVKYMASALKRIGGERAKVVAKEVIFNGDTHYTVEFGVVGKRQTLRVGTYLVEKKLLSLVKCSITDRDRSIKINKTKDIETRNRQELNKRVAEEFKLKPKGDIS